MWFSFAIFKRLANRTCCLLWLWILQQCQCESKWAQRKAKLPSKQRYFVSSREHAQLLQQRAYHGLRTLQGHTNATLCVHTFALKLRRVFLRRRILYSHRCQKVIYNKEYIFNIGISFLPQKRDTVSLTVLGVKGKFFSLGKSQKWYFQAKTHRLHFE